MRFRKDYARPRWLASWHPVARIPVDRSPRDFPQTAGWRRRRYGKPGFSSLHFTEATRPQELSSSVKQALLLEVPRPEAFQFGGEAPPQFLWRRRNMAI